MRTITLWLLVLVALPARANRVDDVLVYADRAQVTRTTAVACRGDGLASFDGLPLSLDVRTLRAHAEGASVLGVTSERVQLEEDWDERVRKLRRERDELDAALYAHDQALAALAARREQTASFRTLGRTLIAEQLASNRPDTRSWSATLALLRGEQESLDQRAVDVQRERRATERKRDLVERQLQRLQPTARAEAWRATVILGCADRAGNVTVSLSYVVPGASWIPEYDLRFVPGGGGKTGPGEVELTTGAVIRQSTGEDWTGAQLSLTTAKPRLGAEAPTLAAIIIDGQEEKRDKVMVQAQEERKELAGPAEPGRAQSALGLEDRGQSFVLRLPRAVTVRADGRPYWFPIDVTRAKAEALLVSVPKLSPFVYQAVRLNNPLPFPILAGTAHVFRRGSFVGSIALPYAAVGEPMEISLGIDGELRAERQDLAAVDRGAGVLSSSQRLERAYQISLTNRARERVSVELRENLPVSKSEEIKVELDKDKTTGGFKLDAERGFLTWTLELGSGKKSVTNLAFTIRLPESWTVR